MNPDLRRLAAMYFLFVTFLCATTTREAQPSTPLPATGRLQGPSRVSRDGLTLKFGAALMRLGFKPAAIFTVDPWWLEPRTAGSPPAVWIVRSRSMAEAVLRRAGSVLARCITDGSGRLLGTRWRYYRGYLCLSATFTNQGGDPATVVLAARPTGSHQARVTKRGDVPSPRPARMPRRTSASLPQKKGPRVAIVLDDAGATVEVMRFLALPIELTVAVLPLVPYSGICARQAARAGHTVILHQPMESIRDCDSGPGTIRSGWTRGQIEAQLAANLESVPGAVGANNHMGSLGTSDAALMRYVLAALQARGMFFLDSRTWERSVAEDTAKSVRIEFAARDVFLDPDGASAAQVRALFRQLILIARRNGHAIGICHVNRPHTFTVLRAMLPEFTAAGVEIVPLTELVR